ncbi:hypothetical protein PIB30_103035, partial [Stylosanthes scabra]|nr:hypothetical protein [Stylosanthes scabra]
KLQQKSWTPRRPKSTPRRPESHPGKPDSTPSAQCCTPRRPESCLSAQIQPQTCLGVSRPSQASEFNAQAPVLKYRRGKPDVAPEAHKNHA